ncbi:MAG: MotA/TolQ/ExbB proton channel family protein [Alphaproteobacteria bacterium]|jgi:chemotaxis protein MotA|nr:MotA/TolQ/ExbB proton channel family protein [Alphaproteobacteria bacterium]MDP6516834.1 MotA/TolQ/ExbB proton channel family protein [Alphaproteobacteria bacterium]
MDIATLIGMIVGFALVGAAITLGGSVMAFVDGPSILIVIGGTFAITTVSFSLGEVIKGQGLMLKAVFNKASDPAAAALQVLELADLARKNGVLGMQESLKNLDDSPFLQKGLSMVVDGTPGDDVEKVMRQEIRGMAARHENGVGILQRAATVAPAMGLIGTLVGLVQMLGNLDDPDAIGPSMAVALLTTLYGAMLANMVFSPMAGKLERNSKEETLLMNVFTLGAGSIGRQENPRRLEILLNALLPPAKRIQFFD